MSHADAERTLELLLEHGVNHLDTAASYGDSELRIASWLKRHPRDFFVATKTDGRDYKSAKEELHRSLERLGVDHVDLLQLHNLVDVIEWEFTLREGGALEAAVEAREEGLVRFIGVTGHGLSIPAMHRRSLERFPFDSVLLPYNFRQMQDERYAVEFEELAAIWSWRSNSRPHHAHSDQSSPTRRVQLGQTRFRRVRQLGQMIHSSSTRWRRMRSPTTTGRRSRSSGRWSSLSPPACAGRCSISAARSLRC